MRADQVNAAEPPPRDEEALGHGDRDLGLREFLHILRRRRAMIIGVIVLVMSSTLLVLSLLTPRYLAETSLLLEIRKTEVVDIRAVMSGLPADVAAVRSEIDMYVGEGAAEVTGGIQHELLLLA